MATATINTAVPVSGGNLDYEKMLRQMYGHTGSGTAGYQNGFGGFTGGGRFGGFGGGMDGKAQGGTNGYINDMYDASLESQKQQLQSNYETDVSNLDAEKEKSAREHDEDLNRTYVESYKKAKNIDIPKEMKENYFLQLDIGDAMKTYDKYYTRLKSE